MRRIGPTEGYVDDELHFNPPEGISHSAYFSNAQAARRMAAWFGLLDDAPRRRTAPAARPRKAMAKRGASRPAARSRPRQKARWTVMVYQAGFNSLNDFAVTDLQEMQAADLDPSVRLSVFQCRNNADGERVAFQSLVGARGRLDERADLVDVDSGRPATVFDFARWTIERAPAERYALVLWSHGKRRGARGLRRALHIGERRDPPAKGALRSGSAARRTLFLTSAVQLIANPNTRYILQDDGAGHSLDALRAGRGGTVDPPTDRRALDLPGNGRLPHELRRGRLPASQRRPRDRGIPGGGPR